jgi:hypothetical protein
LNVASKAFCRTLEVGAHSDNPMRSWHLEYHVWVVWNSHEFRQSWSPNDGVVPADEAYHLEPQELGSVVLWSSKGDEQVYVSEWVLPLGRHDAEEWSIRLRSSMATPRAWSVQRKVTLMMIPPSTNTFFTRLSRITRSTSSG